MVAHPIHHLSMVDMDNRRCVRYLDEHQSGQERLRDPVHPLHPFLVPWALHLEQEGKVYQLEFFGQSISAAVEFHRRFIAGKSN